MTQKKSGVFTFFSKDKKPIFSWLSSNLEKSIKNYSTNPKYEELQSKSTKIEIKLFDSLFGALVYLKQRVPHNQLVKPYSEYVYLALKEDTLPQIELSDDTQAGDVVIGPFRSRFFVSDFVQAFSETFGLVNMGDRSGSSEDLFKYYTQKQSLAKFEVMQKKLSDELKFKQMEELRVRLEFMKRYYDYLDFLKNTKFIDATFEYDKQLIRIKNGLFVTIGDSNFNYEQHYLPSEQLAVEKSELDERLIIYTFLKQKKSGFL